MPTSTCSSRDLQRGASAGCQERRTCKLSRVVVASLGIALSACTGDPTGVSGTRDIELTQPASGPEPTASCVYVALSSTEWQTRVDWSRLPVKSIEFYQGTLGGGSATETLTRTVRRGTLFVRLDFPSTLVRLKDRNQQPLQVVNCVAST